MKLIYGTMACFLFKFMFIEDDVSEDEVSLEEEMGVK